MPDYNAMPDGALPDGALPKNALTSLTVMSNSHVSTEMHPDHPKPKGTAV